MKSSAKQGKPLFRNLEPLVLASASPRRQRLLGSLGLEFAVVVSGVNETISHAGPAEAMVRQWAEAKAQTVAANYPAHWVLAADTIVALGEEVYGKPADAAEASVMLDSLSDREHDVITGICLVHSERQVQRAAAVITRVRFKRLSAAEIQAYVASGEPLDKAGAYGIQGLGAYLVRSVTGSYTNVVGLPLCETIELLVDQRIIASC
jgi:septum formation protein